MHIWIFSQKQSLKFGFEKKKEKVAWIELKWNAQIAERGREWENQLKVEPICVPWVLVKEFESVHHLSAPIAISNSLTRYSARFYLVTSRLKLTIYHLWHLHYFQGWLGVICKTAVTGPLLVTASLFHSSFTAKCLKHAAKAPPIAAYILLSVAKKSSSSANTKVLLRCDLLPFQRDTYFFFRRFLLKRLICMKVLK